MFDRKALVSAVFFVSALTLSQVSSEFSPSANAQGDPIAERQAAMKDNNRQVKVLAAIAKGDTKFDGATVKEASATILAGLTKAQGSFPEGSINPKTSYALPVIWQKPDDFTKRFGDAKAAAGALVEIGTANQADQFRPALKRLGDACGSCHEVFRKPEN